MVAQTGLRSATDERLLLPDDLLDLMDRTLREGGLFSFRARGNSMSPFIRSNDEITLGPFIKRMPSLGDVVAFIQPENGLLLVHRVIGIKNQLCLIQGDNSSKRSVDRVSAGQILGIVVQIIRSDREVHFGLGPEKMVIAWFSRLGLLYPMLSVLRYIKSHVDNLRR